jgi:hypothetical protein
MHNKTIPLRRVRRRREIRLKTQLALNSLNNWLQVAEKYRNEKVTVHFPSGGFITKRKDVDQGEFIIPAGVIQKHRELVELAVQEYLQQTPDNPIVIPDISRDFFTRKEFK